MSVLISSQQKREGPLPSSTTQCMCIMLLSHTLPRELSLLYVYRVRLSYSAMWTEASWPPQTPVRDLSAERLTGCTWAALPALSPDNFPGSEPRKFLRLCHFFPSLKDHCPVLSESWKLLFHLFCSVYELFNVGGHIQYLTFPLFWS